MAGAVEQDNILIEWDVAIVMDDGVVMRADVFRPKAAGKWPVLLTYGPYAKGLAFQKGYPSAWQAMIANHPDVAYGSTNKYQNWEVVDPEKWVPTVMSACASTRAAPDDRPVSSIISRRVKRAIFINASNGRAFSTGRTATSA